MWSILRNLYWICAVILISGCSGGGCAGCAGGALHEIPGGYPLTPETRLPRAAQIRLTETGLRRVEAIAPSLLSTFTGTGFNVPRSTQNLTVGKVILCPSGTCTIHISLPTTPPPFQLAATPPNAIDARVRIVAQGTIPIQACLGSCDDNCHNSISFLCTTIASPDVVIDTHAGSYGYIGLHTHVQISRDTHAEHRDYHRADLVSPTGTGASIQETTGEAIETADINCTGSWICGIVNLLRGTLISQFSSQFANALGPIQDALSQKATPDPPGCPAGTHAVSGTCHYADNTPVPQLLGTEGTGNFGALLAGLAPGLRAPASYLLAAGDHEHDAQAVNNGLSLDMFGALQSGGHSACVPHVAEAMFPAIPEWTSLRGNTIPGTTTAIDLGIGVSEEYLNHAAYQLWDAGLLCIGAGTSSSQSLSTGTLSILPPFNSLPVVTFPRVGASPVAITIRPQTPPQVRVGHGTNIATDPLLTITLNRFALDFYAWSEERYVRIFTVTTDVTLPLNLQADVDGLRPVLGTLHTANTTATNSQLLSNDPAMIGSAIEFILGPALGMLGGAVPAIHLPSVPVPGAGGMLAIAIPPMGAQGVTEGTSRYLGIFANMNYMPAAAHPDSAVLDTTATLASLDLDRDFFHRPAAFRRENLPRATLDVGTPNDFGRGAEYSYRVDHGSWSLFAEGGRMVVQDPAFAFQGTHVVEVRARMPGMPETADPDPAPVTVTIDTEGPHLAAHFDGHGDVVAEATDDGAGARVEYAFQCNDEPRSAWGTTDRAPAPPECTRFQVFARDPAGNETSLTITRAALIRGGRTTDTSAGGCGCSVVGGSASTPTSLAGLAALAALLAFVARRQRDRLTRRAPAFAHARPGAGALAPLGLLALTLAAGWGCASSGTAEMGNRTDAGGGDTGMMADAGPSTCGAGQNRCATTQMCVAAPACPATCMPGFMSGGAPTFDPATCMYDTTACCTRLPPLTVGAAGTYLDMATAPDGTIWLSGYSEGSPDDMQLYGDLIVGRVMTGETMAVAWTHVDGVPSDGMITGDPAGWRGGNSTAGDDVGRFTSIALAADGSPRVAYWDVTHDRLKFATLAGTTWTTHVVDASGPGGRYASLVMLPGAIPAIAYRATVVRDDTVTSVVRLARASSPNPAQASDWTVTDVASAVSPCRAADCGAGRACRQSTGRCETVATTCMATCTAVQACFAGTCQTAYASSWIEGLGPGAHYVRLALDAMGRASVVWYDRDRGNLMLAGADATGHFAPAVILDGEDAMQHDTGDRGIYASAAFDAAGLLHVAYVDGWEERLLYLRVQGGHPMGAPEVIDDGADVGGMPFDDGRHIVGDSASLRVGADGAVRAAYQDSTSGTLRLAVRAVAMGTATWTRTVLDAHDHTGYWSVLNGTHVATWWRNLSNADHRQWGVRLVTVH